MIRISVTDEAKRLVANGAEPDRAAAVALVAAAAAMALHSHDERRREAGDVPEEVAELLDAQREMLREWADRSVRPLL